MFKIPFGKPVKNKDNKWKYHPFFISFGIKLHQANAFPGAHKKQKSNKSEIQMLLLHQSRRYSVQQRSAQWGGARDNDKTIKSSANQALD